MWEDPIVAEVRRARLEIEKECDEDFAQIYARALEVQKNAGVKLVSRPSTAKMTMPEIEIGRLRRTARRKGLDAAENT